jgi:hypothetical protein
MLTPELESSLAAVEFHFDKVSAAILSGEPQVLLDASTRLKQAAVDFSGLLASNQFAHDLIGKEFKLRMANMVDGFAMQRESLIRRNASVERALHVIIPATSNDTYQQSAGQYGSGGVRPSGEFRFIAA